MGMVPKSTKAEIRMFMGLSIQRILACLLALFISFPIAEAIFTNIGLQLLSTAIAIFIIFVLTGRSPTNPKINFAKGIINFIFFFIEPKKLYGNESNEYHDFVKKEALRNEKKNKKNSKAKKNKKDKKNKEDIQSEKKKRKFKAKQQDN